MSPFANESLLDEPFDHFTRVMFAKAVVEHLRRGRDSVSILDVGGQAGLTRRAFSDDRVTIADILPSDDERDVRVEPGRDMPFSDGEFDFVVSFDALEHVPASDRARFLTDCRRVASDAVVLACPTDDAVTRRAERVLNTQFVELIGHDHWWLGEHLEYGLPDRELVTSSLATDGWQVDTWESNPVDLWFAIESASFHLWRFQHPELLAATHRWYNEHWTELGDGDGPCYRTIFVAAPQGQLPPLAQLVPRSSRPELRLELHARIASATNEATRRFGAGEAEAALRRARRVVDELVPMVDASELKAAEGAIDAVGVVPSGGSSSAGLLDRVRSKVAQRSTPEYESWLADVPVASNCDTSSLAVSVLCDARASAQADIDRLVESLRAQRHERWELVFAGGHPASNDDRIHSMQCDSNDRGRVLDELLAGSSGDLVLVLGTGDVLSPDALLLACCAFEHERVDIVYADEDKLRPDGSRFEPWVKPSFSPDLLLNGQLLGGFVVVRRSLIDAIGGFQGYLHASEYDTLLRASERARRIHHVPRILLHREVPIATRGGDPSATPVDRLEMAGALEAHLARQGEQALVLPRAGSLTLLRTHFEHRAWPTVSVVIPFKDKPELLRTVTDGLLQHTAYDSLEVLLVDTGSTDAAVRTLLQELADDPRVRVLSDTADPFNYSAVNNRAAAQASGELLLLLNNDIEVLEPNWLRHMVEWALRPSIGLVGAFLRFPDGRIQHAGVVVGIGGFASHPFARLEPGSWTAFGSPHWVRNWLSVTGACAMIRRELWEDIGGLDESFELCGSDVEIGLRLHQRGLRNVVLPWVELVHHESVSRGTVIPHGDFVASERAYQPWTTNGDPFYSPLLSLADDSCRLRARDEATPDRLMPDPERTSVNA